MPIRRIAFAVVAALSLSAGAFAADAPDAKCPPHPGMGMVSPEQRVMMFADMKQQADAGAVDIDSLRQMQRDKMRKMTDDQRKAYFDGLTKRWNALAPAKQKELRAEAEQWRAAHPRPEGGHEGMHQGGRPGCPHPQHG